MKTNSFQSDADHMRRSFRIAARAFTVAGSLWAMFEWRIPGGGDMWAGIAACFALAIICYEASMPVSKNDERTI
jgi:hypothetical protein